MSSPYPPGYTGNDPTRTVPGTTVPPGGPLPPQPRQSAEYYPPQPPPKRHLPGILWASMGFVAGILTGVVIGVGMNVDSGTLPPSIQPVTTPTTPPPAAKVTPTPSPSKFIIGIKILSKECFGSAGCNVTYRIDPSYDGNLPADGDWTVTYVVRGGDSGPQTNSFQLTGSDASYDQEEFLSTASSHVKLSAKVTQVLSN